MCTNILYKVVGGLLDHFVKTQVLVSIACAWVNLGHLFCGGTLGQPEYLVRVQTLVTCVYVSLDFLICGGAKYLTLRRPGLLLQVLAPVASMCANTLLFRFSLISLSLFLFLVGVWQGLEVPGKGWGRPYLGDNEDPTCLSKHLRAVNSSENRKSRCPSDAVGALVQVIGFQAFSLIRVDYHCASSLFHLFASELLLWLWIVRIYFLLRPASKMCRLSIFMFLLIHSLGSHENLRILWVKSPKIKVVSENKTQIVSLRETNKFNCYFQFSEMLWVPNSRPKKCPECFFFFPLVIK